MLLTEEEAKKRWCPFARAIRSASHAMAAVNRDGPRPDPRALCLASECMAWNWGQGDGKNRRGHCGLASVPQS